MKCNKCLHDKPDSQFRRPSRVCRECKNAYMRELRKRPDIKEKHRIKMGEWRKKNPERQLQIQRKNYKNNGHKHNAKKRLLYKTDPVYKQKRIDAEKRYKASGRRKEMHRRRHALKCEEIREKSAKWKRENPEWVKKYVRRYKDNYWIEHEREQRKKLDDPYVIKVLKKSMDYVVKTKDIPKELIEIQRQKIIIHRTLKQIL